MASNRIKYSQEMREQIALVARPARLFSTRST